MSKFLKGHSRAAKTTAARVTRIREDYAAGMTQSALARRERLSIGQIGRIVRGESWQSIAEPLTEDVIKDSEARLLASLDTPASPIEFTPEQIERLSRINPPPAGGIDAVDKFLTRRETAPGGSNVTQPTTDAPASETAPQSPPSDDKL